PPPSRSWAPATTPTASTRAARPATSCTSLRRSATRSPCSLPPDQSSSPSHLTITGQLGCHLPGPGSHFPVRMKSEGQVLPGPPCGLRPAETRPHLLASTDSQLISDQSTGVEAFEQPHGSLTSGFAGQWARFPDAGLLAQRSYSTLLRVLLAP